MIAAADYPVLPANREAERVILGSILLNNAAFYEAVAALSPGDFSVDSHRSIYAAMTRLSASGSAVDDITLCNELENLKQLESVGGATYVSGLTVGLPLRPSIEHYVRIVKGKAQLRRLVYTCAAAAKRALDAPCADDALADLQQSLLDIQADSPQQSVRRAEHCVDDVLAAAKREREATRDVLGLPTDISTVDAITSGICPGELWYCGARPSRGKSSLAAQMALRNAREGRGVHFVSIEMRRDQLLRRMAFMEASVPAVRDLRNLRPEEFEKYKAALRRIAGMPLWIDDASTITIEQLVARAVLGVKRNHIELVIADYVQRVEARSSDEVDRIRRVSQGLTQLAKDYVPVVGLCQLARPSEHNVRRRPNMTELKGASWLEENAHTILLIHRDLDEQNQFTGVDEVIIEKARDGATGIEPVSFDKTLRFRPRSYMPEGQ